MLYAKVKDNELLVFPYTKDTLRQENPNSNFDERFTVPEWYAQTDQAKKDLAEIVQVTIAPQPKYNQLTHYVTEKNPVLEGGVWVCHWDVHEYEVPLRDQDTNNGT